MAELRQRKLHVRTRPVGEDETEALRQQLSDLAGIDYHRKYGYAATTTAKAKAEARGARRAAAGPPEGAGAYVLTDLRKFAQENGLLYDDDDDVDDDNDEPADAPPVVDVEPAAARRPPRRRPESRGKTSAAGEEEEDDDDDAGSRRRPLWERRATASKAAPAPSPVKRSSSKKKPPPPLLRKRLTKTLDHSRSLPRLSPPRTTTTTTTTSSFRIDKPAAPLTSSLFGGSGGIMGHKNHGADPHAYTTALASLTCPLYSWPDTLGQQQQQQSAPRTNTSGPTSSLDDLDSSQPHRASPAPLYTSA